MSLKWFPFKHHTDQKKINTLMIENYFVHTTLVKESKKMYNNSSF